MVTASMDNVIIYWNSYSGKEAKQVYMPEDMASIRNNNSISKIKFASLDSDEFLLVFTANGDIFVLDKQSESFVSPPSQNKSVKKAHEKSFGRVPQFAMIDKTDNNILSISEKGKCTLHTVEVISDEICGKKNRDTTIDKQVKIELVKEFKLKRHESLGVARQVISVSLQSRLGFFIVASKDGSVGFYNLENCTFLSYLNQDQWNMGFGNQITKRSTIGKSLTIKISDAENDFMKQMTFRRGVPLSAANGRRPPRTQADSIFSPSDNVMQSLQLTTGGRNKDADQFQTMQDRRENKLIESYDTVKIGAMLSTMAKTSSGKSLTPRN